MTHIGNIKRWAAALVCVSLGILSGPILLAAGAGATARATLAPFPASNVDFTGYGDGPGYGMGQWGAFGYAAVEHETYSWILNHYYGDGTVLSLSGNIMSKDPMISVELTENAGAPSSSPRTPAPRSSSSQPIPSLWEGSPFSEAERFAPCSRTASGTSPPPCGADRDTGRQRPRA
jgi:hypothetical protein